MTRDELKQKAMPKSRKLLHALESQADSEGDHTLETIADALVAFAEMAVAAEREACANIADESWNYYEQRIDSAAAAGRGAANSIGKAIRARGEKP